MMFKLAEPASKTENSTGHRHLSGSRSLRAQERTPEQFRIAFAAQRPSRYIKRVSSIRTQDPVHYRHRRRRRVVAGRLEGRLGRPGDLLRHRHRPVVGSLVASRDLRP